MTRRANVGKHPALLAGIGPVADLERAHVQELEKLLPQSFKRLKQLMNSKSPSVALGAIKHLHGVLGVGGEANQLPPYIRNMNVNMFGETKPAPAVNGNVIEGEHGVRDEG